MGVGRSNVKVVPEALRGDIFLVKKAFGEMGKYLGTITSREIL
jgi:hypothetical protein